MSRTSIATLLATPLLLLCPSPTPANPPVQCSYGWGPLGAIALNHKSKIHQHGPLFNYGPYYGYPPFEPYGPWNAYLHYNPWYYGDGYGSGSGGAYGFSFGNGLGLGKHGKCGGCGLAEGWHACWLKGGWFKGHGCGGCGHGSLFSGSLFKGGKCHPCCPTPTVSGGCASCQKTASNADTDPATRFAGVGNPLDSVVFYDGLPALNPAVVPAGR